MATQMTNGSTLGRTEVSSPMLVGYAMLRANFSAERGNFTDSFSPFVLDAVRAKHPGSCTAEEVSVHIRTQYGIQLPALVAKNLLRRAERGHKLVREQSGQGAPRYSCTSDELNKASSVASNYASSTRQQHALSDALLEFASNTYPELAEGLDRESCGDLIASYMDANALPLLRSSLRGGYMPGELTASNHFLVSEFVVVSHDSSEEHFNAFVEIAKGAILAAVIQMDVSSLDASLNQLSIFLDTPLMLDVLGHHGPESQSATLDMIELAKNLGAKIQVFEHTIRETKSVLEAAKEALRSGSRRMESFRVARYFVEANKSAADVEIALQRIDESVRNHQIKVVDKPDDYARFGLDESILTQNVQQEVHHQNLTATHYDVDSIHGVHRIRKGRAGERLDQAKALFVTSNSGVVRAADLSREAPHEFPLAVLDSTLASLLWVRSPLVASDLPAKQVIATAWAGMQPEPGRWAEYLADVERLENAGDISHDDALLIRLSSESQHELMRESRGQAEKFIQVAPSTIIHNIKSRATAPLEAEISELKVDNLERTKRAEETEISLREQLETAARLNAETSTQLLAITDAQERQRARIISEADKTGLTVSRLVLGAIVLVIGGVAALSTVGSELTQTWPEWLRSVISVAGFIVAGLIAVATVTKFDIFAMRSSLSAAISRRSAQRRLARAGLE